MRTGRVAARASRALQKAAPRARAPAPRLAPQCRAIAQELGLSSQDELLDDTLCAPAFVSCENEPGEGTKLSVRVMDYKGVLQVISWVLKGLECRVRAAQLGVDEDGMVDDTFWLTNLRGQQLSDERAHDVVERVRDFVTLCTPVGESRAIEWRMGPIRVDNSLSKQETVVTVLEASLRVGFLLEIASVMAGIGIRVLSARVYTCAECGDDPVVRDFVGDGKHPPPEGEARVIQLHVGEETGGPLREQNVQAVLFTLGLLLGKGHASTVVPNAKSFATRFAD